MEIKVNSDNKTARIVGVLFVTGMVAYFLSDEFLLAPILSAPDYLGSIYPNKTRVMIAVLLWLIVGVSVVGIAAMMFPILKQHNESLALGYVGFRVIEFAIIIVHVISPLLLLTLSQRYVQAEAPDASYFQTFGTLLLEGRYWTGEMIAILVGLGGLTFCYLLYRSELIPRVISGWGLIGYALLLTGVLLELFGPSVGMIISLPGGLFEIFLAIWLIVKGFNSSAVVSGSANPQSAY